MKHFAKTLLAAGVLAISSLSNAAIVTNWDVTATGTWFSYGPAGVVNNPANTLRWGTDLGDGQSSLVISNPAVSSVTTLTVGDVPGAANIAPSISLTHNNNPISGTSLTNATLRVGLKVKPTAPDVEAQFPLGDIDYFISFKETPNTRPCASVSAIPCNDIFVLLDGFLNEDFMYKGQQYFVNAFPTTGGVLSTLTNDECGAAGRPNGCFGFTTVERENTKLSFGLTISTVPITNDVPEPGSLALFGLALAGVGFASRRRSSAS